MAHVRSGLPRATRVIEHLWISVADGTRLNARVRLPVDAASDPVPAILEASPYHITESDPLSARSRLVADSDLARGAELDVHVHTDCELRSDAKTFSITNHQRVTDHGEVVWEKSWETHIPRDLG